jgi:sterol 3beta-glucosyltransferase
VHCTILAIGSQGDVQPLIALGAGLKAAGIGVRVGAPADFEQVVRVYELEFFPLTGNASRFFSGPAGIALRERTRHAGKFLRFFEDYLGTFLEKLLVSCWEASQGTDAVLCWPWTRVGPSLAERLEIPVFIVSVNPVLHLPTRAFANPFQGPTNLRLGPLYNRLTWQWALPFTQVGQGQIDHWRQKTLGLATIPWRRELWMLRRLPHLFGYSPAVLPKPSDWADWLHITGYWFLDRPENFCPPPELEAFLAAGPPPVAIGFSSQVGRNAKQITQVVVDALTRSRKRGILISGWGGLKGIELPETIFPIRFVPYDWLLPRISAMIHHGGSGSTAAALRAGLPSFAVPFGYEQGLWGQQIAKLGVGLKPIMPDRLTADRLARAICRVSEDGALRSRAARLGESLRGEDGIGHAVRIIEQVVQAKAIT